MAKQRYWYIDKHRIGIVEKATNAVTKENKTSDYASISEVKDLRIYGIMKPDALGSDIDSTSDAALTEIPDQFHELIVSKAIANGYKDPRNLNIELAQFFEGEYIMGVREAKKFSKSRYRKGGYIKAYDF